jgi:hypothetical protein
VALAESVRVFPYNLPRSSPHGIPTKTGVARIPPGPRTDYRVVIERDGRRRRGDRDPKAAPAFIGEDRRIVRTA